MMKNLHRSKHKQTEASSNNGFNDGVGGSSNDLMDIEETSGITSISPAAAAANRRRKGSNAVDVNTTSIHPDLTYSSINATHFTMHNIPPLTTDLIEFPSEQLGEEEAPPSSMMGNYGPVGGLNAGFGSSNSIASSGGGTPRFGFGRASPGVKSGGGSTPRMSGNKRGRTGSYSPVPPGERNRGGSIADGSSTVDGNTGEDATTDSWDDAVYMANMPVHTTSISWDDVVLQFQVVQKEENEEVDNAGEQNIIVGGMDTILIAPKFRKLEGGWQKKEREEAEEFYGDDDSTEEDMSDETVLNRHEVILEQMRIKIALCKDKKQSGGNNH